MILSTPAAARDAVRGHSDRLFSARRLRADAGAFAEGEEDNMTGLAPVDSDLAGMLPRSLLPAFLDLAREKGINVVFFRVKRRPGADGTPYPDPPQVAAYIALLKDYLLRAGAGSELTFLGEIVKIAGN
ncbi:MAG: hypothetical protein O3C21_00310 [Verrucomicrobia bacterium]|nr:hypothetical protein [Verrucomicrobiota bacterium]